MVVFLVAIVIFLVSPVQKKPGLTLNRHGGGGEECLRPLKLVDYSEKQSGNGFDEVKLTCSVIRMSK